jgi:hypothetical protein
MFTVQAGLRINGAANAPYATTDFEIVPATAPGLRLACKSDSS